MSACGERPGTRSDAALGSLLDREIRHLGSRQEAERVLGRWGFEQGRREGWRLRLNKGRAVLEGVADAPDDAGGALVVRAQPPGADAHAEIHVAVRPSTGYRISAHLRTQELLPEARLFGTLYTAELAYFDLRGDRNDALRWHIEQPLLKGTSRTWREISFDLLTTPRTRMLRIAVPLANWGTASGAVIFDDVQIVELGNAGISTGSVPTRVRDQRAMVLGESRRALRAPPPSELRIALRIPADAELALGMGLESAGLRGRQGDGVLFSVELDLQGETHALLRSHLGRDGILGEPWRDATIPLWQFSGAEGELVLRTQASPVGAVSVDRAADFAVWSDLRLSQPGSIDETRAAPAILMITIDTLRPDRLGCYGHHVATSPEIDRLARDAVRFENAFTTIPRTSPALASLMTGRYPRDHGARSLLDALPDSATTLAEELRMRGYSTAAFVTKNAAEDTGLLQGFDTFVDHRGLHVNHPDAGAAHLAARARRWLSGRLGDKFFCWLHVWDPHFQYRPEEPDRCRFDSTYGAHFDLYQRIDTGELSLGQIYFDNPLSQRDVEHAKALYDAEIAATDRAIGELLAELRRLDLYDATLIVLTSDHGESLGEHDYHFEHGEFLYDETLRIPLLVKLPEQEMGGSSVSAPTSLIDLHAWLRTIGTAEIGPRAIASLVSQGASEDDSTRALYAESGRRFFPENPRREVEGLAGRWTCVRRGRWKLIRIPRLDSIDYELYDLDRDREELDDRSAERPAVVARLAALLENWSKGRHSERETPLDPTQERRLRSLGYLD